MQDGKVAFDAGLGFVGPQYRFGGGGGEWTRCGGGGSCGPQYVSRGACVDPTPSIMPALAMPPCPECQPWPPFSPCPTWPPPGTPYYGRPDQPPAPGTVLAC
jgi:hypothetical protein